jgi:hypothetical protein
VAKLADLQQREAALVPGQTTMIEQAERQLPTFARANQNMAMTASLLDTLSTPSTNGVGEVYQQLKSIVDTSTAQQQESSLQHQVEASISTPI